MTSTINLLIVNITPTYYLLTKYRQLTTYLSSTYIPHLTMMYSVIKSHTTNTQ